MESVNDTLEYYANLVDLLSVEIADPDVMQILHARDLIEREKAVLNPFQRGYLAGGDAKLRTKWKIVAEFVPHPAHQDRNHWWWFLHEGPQVREQAQELVYA